MAPHLPLAPAFPCDPGAERQAGKRLFISFSPSSPKLRVLKYLLAKQTHIKTHFSGLLFFLFFKRILKGFKIHRQDLIFTAPGMRKKRLYSGRECRVLAVGNHPDKAHSRA